MNLRDFGYRIVQIETTNRCNMRCTFCPLPIRDAPFRDVPAGRVLELLERLARWQGIEYVAFHQFGEPLLYDELWSCIDACRVLGLRSQVVTNGLSLTPDKTERLLAHPPSILRISVQTLVPEYHERMRGITVPFDVYIRRVADALGQFLQRDHRMEEIRTDLAVNEDRYVGVSGLAKRAAKALGVSDPGDPTIFNQTPKTLRPRLVEFLRLIAAAAPSFCVSLEHLDSCIARYYSAEGRRLGWEVAYELQPKNQISYKRFWNGRRIANNFPVEKALCGTDILGILADGTVTCCCLDYKGFTGLGNVFTEDLGVILERSRAILEGLQKTGDLHFDGCKTCMGAPTRLGASIKNTVNWVRYRTQRW